MSQVQPELLREFQGEQRRPNPLAHLQNGTILKNMHRLAVENKRQRRNLTSEGEMEMAANEYVLKRLPMKTSMEEIEARFGEGTEVYFMFTKYLVGVNIVLAIAGLVMWGVFVARDSSARTVLCNYPNFNMSNTEGCAEKTRPLRWHETFFTSAFSHREQKPWLIYACVCIGIWLIAGPLFWLLDKIFDDETSTVSTKVRTIDVIPGNINYPAAKKYIFRALFAVVFFMLLPCTAFLTYLSKEIKNGTSFFKDLLTNILSLALIGVANVVYSVAATQMTNLERYNTWSTYNKMLLLRKFFFKICNTSCGYFAMAWNKADPYTCQMHEGASYFVLHLVLELAKNALEVIKPLGKAFAFLEVDLFKCFRNKGSDEDTLPRFLLAEEYQELLYRQFLSYLASLTCPAASVLVPIINIVEYFFDKWRMLKLCKKKLRVDDHLSEEIMLGMLIAAVFAVFVYPYGFFWLLTGKLTTIHDDCDLWRMTDYM